MGGFKCKCPEGYIRHPYFNQCLDDNECASNPCGEAGCINTLGSYQCGCPQGFQFDQGAQLCLQVCFFVQESIGLYKCCLGEPFVYGESMHIRMHTDRGLRAAVWLPKRISNHRTRPLSFHNQPKWINHYERSEWGSGVWPITTARSKYSIFVD